MAPKMAHTCFYLAAALLLQVAQASDGGADHHEVETNNFTHNITWAYGVLPFADQDNTAHVEGGDILNFVSIGGDHDVVKFLNEAHYDACSFAHGVVVHAMQSVPFSETVVVGTVVSSDDVRWDYYGCSILDHCTRNMKVKVMAHRKGTFTPVSDSSSDHSHGPTDAKNHSHEQTNETVPTSPASGASQVPFFGVIGLALVALGSVLLLSM
jgi:hypothetical protein